MAGPSALPCLDEAQVLELVAGKLAGEELFAAERHMASCDECRVLVSELARAAGPGPRTPDPVSGDDPTELAPTRASAETPAAPRRSLGAIAASPVAPGDVLAGKYVVERVLGAGGMGVVVAAKHAQLGQRVALKFLLPAAVEHAGAVARFLREGRAAVQIQGEHVARVTDVGTLESGAPYMVMEFLRGVDFAELLRRRGALPVGEAVDYVLQACEAIAEAHALGIVHRDLKPANVFLTTRPDGSPLVKVLDFGISKINGGSMPTLTSRDVMVGSPRYMAPEQMTSPRDVDHRADVWAVGVLLYELVSGRAPFEGESMVELSTRILTEPAPPLRRRCPSAPAGLEAVVAACLEKDRAKRKQNVAQVAEALLPFASPAARVSVERIARMAHGSLRTLVSGATSPRASIASTSAPPAAINAARGGSEATGGAAKTWGTVAGVAALVVAGLTGAGLLVARAAAEPQSVEVLGAPSPAVVVDTAATAPALVQAAEPAPPPAGARSSSWPPPPSAPSAPQGVAAAGAAGSAAASRPAASAARRTPRVASPAPSTAVDTNRAALLDRK